MNEEAKELHQLHLAISGLSESVKAQTCWFQSHMNCATRKDLEEMEKHIMEAIQSFATRVNTKFAAIAKSVDGIVADVDDLKAQIAALQGSPGVLTAEDQAALDAVEATVGTLDEKTAALDAATSQTPTPTP